MSEKGYSQMTNSYRHVPIVGFCTGGSEKFYKVIRNRRERVRVRSLLAGREFDMVKFEQVPWDEFATERDGKMWLGFNAWTEYPSLMRK